MVSAICNSIYSAFMRVISSTKDLVEAASAKIQKGLSKSLSWFIKTFQKDL
jgi:hypothetical protein